MPLITTADMDTAFDCGDDDTILRAALRAGVGMPYSCNVGSCGNCRFELVAGEVVHRRLDSPAHTERDRKRNRWLGCQAAPRGDCVVRFRPDPAAVPPHRPAKRRGELLDRRMLNHDIAEFAIRIDGPPGFLPGQYALFGLDGVVGERVYSMCNLPDSDVWRFQIKKVPGGAATTRLFDVLDPGAALAIDGPYGAAYLRAASPREIVLLAGGSGLSPMVSIARGALAAPGHPDRRVHFFLGGRGPRDIAAGDFLKEIADPRFHFTGAISDPSLAEGWGGALGFIHEIADEGLSERLADCEIYFAGPPAMAAAIQRLLRDRGVPLDQAHYDEFY